MTVYEQDLWAMHRTGIIQHLENGSYVLTGLTYYSRETGLALDVQSGEALFI